VESVLHQRNPNERELTRKTAEAEWEGILAWAVGQAMAKTPLEFDAIRAKVQAAVSNETDDTTDEFDPDGEATIKHGKRTRATSPVVVKGRLASAIKDGIPEWVWEHDDKGRLQRDTLALFAGRPEVGKSTAARYFAAGYTNGTIDGCFWGKPQNVGYYASEESITFAVKPSLRAHKADLSPVHMIHTELLNGQVVPLLSTRDETKLAKYLCNNGITVLLVDPLMSTIANTADINRNNQVHEYVEPWQRISEAIHGIVIGLVHLVKVPGGDILAAINGSSAFGEVARGVIAFANAPDADLRVLSQEKNNAGFNDLSMTFSIEDTDIETDEGPTRFGQLVLGEPSDIRVRDMLRTDEAKGVLGQRSYSIMEAVRQAGEPVDAEMAGKLVPDMSRADVGRYLRRLAQSGLLIKTSRGLYDVPVR
jgi:hypothetical protein